MALLNKLNIGKRLLLGFGLVLLFFILAVVVGILGMDKLRQTSATIEGNFQVVKAAEDFRAMNAELSLVLMDIIVDKSSGQVTEQRKNIIDGFKKELEEDENNIKEIAADDTEKEKFKQIITNLRVKTKIAQEDLLPAVARSEADDAFWVKIDDDLDKVTGQNQEIIAQIIKDAREGEENAKADALSIRKNAWYYLIGLLALGVILSIFITLSIRRSIIKPVRDMIARAGELAEGEVDMAKRLTVDTKDELGKLGGLFNKFLDRLQALVVKINDTSNRLSNSIERITGGGLELATRTNEQAASVTETSTTIEEFSTILKQNSDNSEETRGRLEKFNTEIQAKKDLISNVTATMTEISDSSKKIDNIVNVINDISFQTNLLALNAAVEAARAGEAGRGFAVVASEVRNLAQKTAESSKTIQDIVTQNVESTQKGMDLIRETSDFFESIVKTFHEIADKIQQIADGSQEQSTGVEQINLAIAQLEIGINQNAALVDEFSTSGKDMKVNAKELADLMENFKIGSTPAPAPGPEHKKPLSKKAVTPPAPKKETKKEEKPVKKETKSETKSKTITKVESEEDFFAAEEGGFEEF